MKNKKIKFNFLEYIKKINSENGNITINNSIYPQMGINIYDILSEDFKKLVYTNIYNRLVNLILIMYEWKMPETISKRIIEIGYLYRGSVAFFKELKKSKNKNKKIDGGFYCLPAITSNIYNIYGDPTQVRVEGFNGYNKNIDIVYDAEIPTNFEKILNNSEGYGVYSRDNETQYPYIFYVDEYACKLTDKVIALNIATQKLKKPFIFLANKPYIKDDIDELINKINKNEETVVIIQDKNDILDKNKNKPFEAINIATNGDSVKEIQNAINFDFNMFLETIGINTNPSPDKSQVVLSAEINSNNLLIDLEQEIRYKNRLKFCEDIKKIFNIDVSVKLNIDELQKEIKKTKEALNGDTATDKQEN